MDKVDGCHFVSCGTAVGNGTHAHGKLNGFSFPDICKKGKGDPRQAEVAQGVPVG
jgi:hypothetical protein